MLSTTQPALSSCVCQTIGAPAEVRLCEEHHAYWRGDRRLTSVTAVVKGMWPEKPDFSAAPEGVIENARERGVEVDTLFTAYLRGKLHEIPAGTREDSADLFMKLVRWWEKRSGMEADAQVILADDEIAGCADIVPPKAVYDLKTTYDLEPTYSLQVGGYCHLYEAQYGVLPEECGIIHLTKRFAEPKLVKFEVMTVVSEFRIVRDMWRLTRRLSRRKSA